MSLTKNNVNPITSTMGNMGINAEKAKLLQLHWKNVQESLSLCGSVPSCPEVFVGLALHDHTENMALQFIEKEPQPTLDKHATHAFNHTYYQKLYALLYTQAARLLQKSDMNAIIFGEAMGSIISGLPTPHKHLAPEIKKMINIFSNDRIVMAPQQLLEQIFFQSPNIQKRVNMVFTKVFDMDGQ